MFSTIISIAMLIAWVVSHNDVLIIGAGLFAIAAGLGYLSYRSKQLNDDIIALGAIIANKEMRDAFMEGLRKDEK